MKKLKSILILLFAFQAASAQHIAKYAGEFLSIGVGGRALGLGGAYTALAYDASAAYWNPAALARLNYPEFMLMHDERYGGIVNYDFGAAAVPYGENTTFALSLMRLGVDGIPDSRFALVDGNQNGVLDSTDFIDPDRISYFNSADWALYLTYSKRLSFNLTYGINFKILYRNLSVATATGFGFDIGVLYIPQENWYIAANLQDVTTTLVAWTTGTNELISPTLKLGTVYFFNLFNGRFAPTFDVDVRFEGREYASAAHLGPVSLDPHFGIEFDYKNTAALRVGYSDVKQLTLGAGLHFRMLDIDYSFAKFGTENDLGDTHRISLRVVLREQKFARATE
ncbi:MAG: PorV/PorQ family protein [Bacteroidetes bacterium]|nr:PorV/PorQ family protein [Bacteroidota bacterium]